MWVGLPKASASAASATFSTSWFTKRPPTPISLGFQAGSGPEHQMQHRIGQRVAADTDRVVD